MTKQTLTNKVNKIMKSCSSEKPSWKKQYYPQKLKSYLSYRTGSRSPETVLILHIFGMSLISFHLWIPATIFKPNDTPVAWLKPKFKIFISYSWHVWNSIALQSSHAHITSDDQIWTCHRSIPTRNQIKSFFFYITFHLKPTKYKWAKICQG